NSRLRAHSEDRPDPVRARSIRYFRRRQTGAVLAPKPVADDWNAAALPPGVVQMGNEEHIWHARISCLLPRRLDSTPVPWKASIGEGFLNISAYPPGIKRL